MQYPTVCILSEEEEVGVDGWMGQQHRTLTPVTSVRFLCEFERQKCFPFIMTITQFLLS